MGATKFFGGNSPGAMPAKVALKQTLLWPFLPCYNVASIKDEQGRECGVVWEAAPHYVSVTYE